MDQATFLLQRAVRMQATYMESGELVERSTPVLWYGQTGAELVTVGVNPSKGEFLLRSGCVRPLEQRKFFTRDKEGSLQEFHDDEIMLRKSISYFQKYFANESISRPWFGQEGGAKLEGFLQGMGASFYRAMNESMRAIHVDYFPFATIRQMGKIPERETWFEDASVHELFKERVLYLKPKRLLSLGATVTEQLCALGAVLGEKQTVEGYPSAMYQTGTFFGIPMVVLHFRPSEQFVGLGSKVDSLGRHHGSYTKKEVLAEIGRLIGEGADW
ncbi:hypothetical protein FLK61_40985 [Paenalkalicoccus suaedae]|uniref:Uracil-DNA glycosylase-like domain-containing protein n=1 Tax=Paenalkalicoccus suaedae TaxID=2592382 RepID=A0A859FJL5_9BACI|nr:hypothetical protein [Paenalkalicoccus suaedae]QKS72976.1 hypothetical protein FLK61_40985 [Paenalkalicoccus suaedae]